MTFDGMAQRGIGIDIIRIAAAFAVAAQDLGLFEVRENLSDGSLGYTDYGRQIANSEVGIFGQRDENVSVVAQEGPALAAFVHFARGFNPR
jgi:hypothetical protein